MLIIRPEARTAQSDGADRCPPLLYSFLEFWLLSFRTDLSAQSCIFSFPIFFFLNDGNAIISLLALFA